MSLSCELEGRSYPDQKSGVLALEEKQLRIWSRPFCAPHVTVLFAELPDTFSGLLSILLFLLPDPEDWRVSVLSATHPVLDSLHTPDAYLVLLESGLLISWCVKESPEGLSKPRNWGHTLICLGSEHLGWSPRFCISNQLPGVVDVTGSETSLGSSSALRK